MSEPRMPSRMEDAARWFAVLRRGVMSIEERAAYETWRRDHANRAAMSELEEIWNALGLVEDRALETESLGTGSARRGRLTRPALVAAMCAVSLAIGLMSYNGQNSFWTTLDWTDR